MKPLSEAMADPKLFGRTFAGATFWGWRTVAKILDGRRLDARELALYRELTGREQPPSDPFSEAYFVMARRSGKTLFAAAVGLYAALQDYRARLGPGEVATIALIASDRRQARQLMRYVKGLIAGSPLIAAEVANVTAEGVEFRHGTMLEIHVASFRSTRGYSYAAVILDELAFYRDDLSANPDVELVRAVRPGLANLNGLLLGLSSPHSRRGHLFDMYQRHFGKASDVLVIQAAARVLNLALKQSAVDRSRAEDPTAARSEWDAQFREDVSQWLADELIDTALEPGRLPQGDRDAPVAFVDMSGGRHDASVLAIAHAETAPMIPQDPFRTHGTLAPPIVRLDALHCVPAPHEPAVVVERFAKVLEEHRLHRVVGDRYAGAWVADAFEKAGITYEAADLDKSSIYNEALPLFAERRVELLDDKRLVTELRLLERRPRAGGRPDAVDHPPRAHDDCANACAGALWLASVVPAPMSISDAALDLAAWGFNAPLEAFSSAPPPRAPAAQSPQREQTAAERYAQLSELQEDAPLPPSTGPQRIA